MRQIVLDISDDTLSALNLLTEDAGAILRLAAAIKLFEVGKLSSGAAAQLAGIPRTLFLSKLADFDVATFSYSHTELEEDMRIG